MIPKLAQQRMSTQPTTVLVAILNISEPMLPVYLV
jgi:hypothetical protein